MIVIRSAIFLWASVIFYYAFITFLSSLPPKALDPGFTFPFFDKMAHFLIYLGLGFLLTRLLIYVLHLFKTKIIFFIVFSLVIIFLAAVDEWHQSFREGRDSDFWDAVADLCGAWAGIWIYFLLKRTVSRIITKG